MHRRFSPRIRKPRPWQGCYSTTSLSTMVFRPESTATRVNFSSQNSSRSCAGLLEWRSLERHPTTPWETAKWSVLTRLCFRYLGHWKITGKVIAKHTSRHLFTPTMRHSTTPQGSPGVGRNTFLSSPHLCFIIVFICDLFVSRDDPLMG